MRKNKMICLLLCVMFILGLMPVKAKADIGPKPSVTVTIRGLEDEVYYATLLSKHKSTGPASVYDGSYARYKSGDEGYDIWQKFVAYEDSDGYYFLQEFWNCSDKNEFRWGYYPPTPFKILLYFPEQDAFIVSGIYERYAFDTYYSVDLQGLHIESVTVDETIIAEKCYDYSEELINLAVRIAATILIELVIALLFGLRTRKQLLLLTGVNVFTQVVLNVLLNIVNYNKGHYAFVFYYILLELLVFVIEALVYAVMLTRISNGQTGKGKVVFYAFAANAASFGLGLWLAQVVPGIF
ncbi:MAG: hypothetical protein IKK59_08595 [Lachnospiraceae bacterium]|nr:hypothetical protein [Lachnospiraceae bacterium]